MAPERRIRLRRGLAERLRETRNIPSERAQAALIGVDRTTLRRVAEGGTPSNGFMAQFCIAFDLGIGEAFEVDIDHRDLPPGSPHA